MLWKTSTTTSTTASKQKKLYLCRQIEDFSQTMSNGVLHNFLDNWLTSKTLKRFKLFCDRSKTPSYPYAHRLLPHCTFFQWFSIKTWISRDPVLVRYWQNTPPTLHLETDFHYSKETVKFEFYVVWKKSWKKVCYMQQVFLSPQAGSHAFISKSLALEFMKGI